MTAVTQQIPNLILGISEQPDELKIPGQVKECSDFLPDVTEGLKKRPGSRLIKKISVNGGVIKWFNIYNDKDNQYIGCINTLGQLQIWRTRDGFSYHDNNGQGNNLIDYTQVTGVNSSNYLTGWTKESDIQALTLNEQTFLTNRTKTTSMKPVRDSNNVLTGFGSPELVNEAIVEIRTISFGKQYALNIYDPSNPGAPLVEKRATAIAHTSVFTDTNGANDGSCQAQGRQIIHNADNVNPTPHPGNNLRYEVDVRCVPVVDPNNLGGSSSGPEYNDSYTPYAKLQFGGEGWDTGAVHDYTTKKGGSGRIEVTAHVEMRSSANIAAVRPPATSSTADEAVTAAGILGGMKTALDAIANTGITATITGNCLHLKRATPFAVSTPEPQLMNVITNDANDITELPSNCRHNYVVRIVNSGDSDDDFYVKFKQANAGTSGDFFGEGVWEECPAPSIEIEIDKTTMPVRIVRELPGNVYPEGRFLVQEVDFTKRDVGDDNTNPVPSFIGSNIEKMLFFRNRLVVLSKGNAILSKTNDFFNFFSSTAMSESTADPIDIQASATFPTTLFDGIEVNAGLLLFSPNQQFMLTTDSDALTPSTAKINYLCSYNYDPSTSPFSLGQTIAFINRSGSQTRVFEMTNIRREGEPTVLEQSKLIASQLTDTFFLPTISKENQLYFLGGKTNAVYGFKYFSDGEKRVQSAWFKWFINGFLEHHAMFTDVYYQVVRSRDIGFFSTIDYPHFQVEYTLEAFDIKTREDTLLSNTGPTNADKIRSDNFPIHLDRHSVITTLPITAYDEVTNKTTFTRPLGYLAGTATIPFRLKAYCPFVGAEGASDRFDNIGREADINVPLLQTPIVPTPPGGQPEFDPSILELEGNWTGFDFVIGYSVSSFLELPKFYVTKTVGDKTRADIRSSLVIHRSRVSFGDVGSALVLAFTQDQKSVRFHEFDSMSYNRQLLNRQGITNELIFTASIYEKNDNFNFVIFTQDARPLTIFSVTWEGDYNPRSYQRV